MCVRRALPDLEHDEFSSDPSWLLCGQPSTCRRHVNFTSLFVILTVTGRLSLRIAQTNHWAHCFEGHVMDQCYANA